MLVRAGLWLLAAFLVAAGVAAWAFRSTLADLPDIASLRDYRPPVVSTLWSRDGELMAELSEERRKVVDVRSLPPHVVRAFLAAEDSQFFGHEGLDWRGILRAVWANLREQRVVQGGSTITQQVAKSLLLSPERSFRRKLREAVLAVRIERNLTKDQILHLYLNQIYLGHGAYGIESASEVFFGTSSQKLSLPQAALLAGLPQAPSRYNPYQNPERALERRRYVLNRMADEGWISREEAALGVQEPLQLHGYRNPYGQRSPYFSEHVRRLVEARYGREALSRDGLRIVTTMDARLQAAAQEALRRGLEDRERRLGYRGPLERGDPAAPGPFAGGEPPRAGHRQRALVQAVDDAGAWVLAGGARLRLPADALAWALAAGQKPPALLKGGDVILVEPAAGKDGALTASLAQEPQVEGALVCLAPRTGEVLALVGGYDFGRSQFNRAVQAQRQAGSAIKPLLYAAAVEKGFTPATLIYDTPIVYESADLDEAWKPKNFTDQFYGATTLREALVHSRNVVTIKVLKDLGLSYAISYLRTLGFAGAISPDLSLALGASSTTPLELTSAYGVFAAEGLRQPPAFVLRVEDRDGQVLEAFTPGEPQRAMGADTAYVLTHMLQAVITEGTGRRASGLGRPAAGKTGTTNDNRDTWFVGFTPDLVAGVWVGYDDGRSLGKGETGGRATAPVWLDFMTRAVQDRPAQEFQVPGGVEIARIDAATGALAGATSRETFTAAFLHGSVPAAALPGRADPERPASAAPLDPRDPSSLDALR
ncbi:MAG: penicillin-binding protein 1A [Deferrisomatales bacterium]